jgi:hypothetical protein
MTHGYISFWRSGSVAVAQKQGIVNINKAMKEELKKAKKY